MDIFPTFLDMVPLPSVVFNKDMQGVCGRAISRFLDNHLQCSCLDPGRGERCVNTKVSHALGHQGRLGTPLEPGDFDPAYFHSARFVSTVHNFLNSTMQDIKGRKPSNRRSLVDSTRASSPMRNA